MGGISQQDREGAMGSLTIGPVPSDTAWAIRNVPDLNPRYLRIGDNLNAILAAEGAGQVSFSVDKPLNLTVMLALVTIFQQLEGYTDQNAAEAMQRRADWKYALHLPLSYAGFDSGWLCSFRKYIFGETSGAVVVQAVIDHLVEIDAFDLAAGKHLIANEVLSSICKLNRIVQITEVMLLAVDALATRENLQLADICLPDLYEHYTKTYYRLQQIETSEEMNLLAQTIGVDISRLWNAFQLFGEDGLQQWPEMEHLRDIWREQYDQVDCSPQCTTEAIWQPVNCLRCNLRREVPHPP